MTSLLSKIAHPFSSSSRFSIPWGNWKLPFESREDQFMIMGTAGSGKTVGFTQLYAAIFPHITPQSTQRVFLYDVKGDALPILHALSKKGLIHPDLKQIYFNPRDPRTHAWDIAADFESYPKNQIDDPIHLFANNLFPSPAPSRDTSASFFHDKIIELTLAVLRGFVVANIPWTLQDLLDVLYYQEKREKICSLTPSGQEALRQLGADETALNINSSIAARLTRYGQLARFMQFAHDQGRRFTAKQWLTEPSILVTTGPRNPDDPLAALNRALLAQVFDHLLSRPDTRSDITWIFLDEISTMGSLPAIPDLMRLGRSKGATLFIGMQDISGMYKAIGDRDDARSLLAQVKNTAFLYLPDIESARYASERSGEVRRLGADKVQRVEPRYPPTFFQDQDKFTAKKGLLPGLYRVPNQLPDEALTRPQLLELDHSDAPLPLGQERWPEHLEPRENLALSELFKLGSPAKEASKATFPTTGRIYAE